MPWDRLDRRGLIARKPSAARRLLSRFGRILRRYVRDTTDVRELSQSASADILRRLREDPQASTRRVERWTQNSAINALQRHLRRKRRQVVEYQSQLHAAPEPDQEQLLVTRRELERISRTLARLRDLDEQALVAKVFGYTDAEIAARLNTTKGTVRSSVSRTRATLRLELTEDERREELRQMVRDAMEHHEQERLHRVFRARAAESSS